MGGGKTDHFVEVAGLSGYAQQVVVSLWLSLSPQQQQEVNVPLVRRLSLSLSGSSSSSSGAAAKEMRSSEAGDVASPNDPGVLRRAPPGWGLYSLGGGARTRAKYIS